MDLLQLSECGTTSIEIFLKVTPVFIAFLSTFWPSAKFRNWTHIWHWQNELHCFKTQQGEFEGQIGIDRALGPLENSRSRRYDILAGLWTATFLSVSLSVQSELA